MGIYSTDLPLVAALDEVVGNVAIDGIQRSARQSMADHAQQIAANGPIADALAAEATARENGDTALDQRIDTLEAANLPARMDAVEDLALSGVRPAKQSVRLLITTATDASAMTAGATLDGLVLVAGDRIARATAAGASADGVYVVQAAGAAIRSADMNTSDEIVGARFDVDAGTHAAETWAMQTPAPITVDTTALVFVRTTSASALSGQVADLAAEVADIAETVATPVGGDNAAGDVVVTIADRVVGVWTKDGQFRPLTPFHPDDVPSGASGTATASYAENTKYLVSPNEMGSQWAWPRTVEDDEGNQFHGSMGRSEGPLVPNGTGLVGRPGPLWLGYREAYSGSTRKKFIGYSEEGLGVWAARGKVDDHGRPAVIIHPNPAAPIQLAVLQSDHSGLQWSRFWRSATKNPDDLVLVGQTPTTPGDFHSYAQMWWNGISPNQLRGAYRIGGFDTGVWSFFECDPAGTMASWTHYPEKIGGEGTYFLTVPALDGSGTWLACVRHPTVTGAKKITLAKLLWDWSLVAGDGTVISADIRAEATPIDILDDADVTTIDTATGDRRFRLFDAREYADGLVRFLYADFPTVGKASTAGDYKIATYNPATDSTTIETVCGCGGKIQEEVSLDGEYVAGSGSSSYVAGACLTDRPTEIVASRWWNTYGDLLHCVRQGADDWGEVEIDRAAGKIFRPEGHARQYWEGGTVKEDMTPRVSYLRGSGPRGGYAMFYNFNADRITIDLTAFRSSFV